MFLLFFTQKRKTGFLPHSFTHKRKVLISFCERKKQQRRNLVTMVRFLGLNEQLPFQRIRAMERINRRACENVRAVERSFSRRVPKTRARALCFFFSHFCGRGGEKKALPLHFSEIARDVPRATSIPRKQTDLTVLLVIIV